MKIEVLKRFVEGGVLVRYPGEVLEVTPEEGEPLVERGIAKEVKPPKPKAKKDEGKDGREGNVGD